MMMDFIWGYKEDPNRDESLKLLDLTYDKKVTVEEIRLLYRYHKEIFKPIFDIQEIVRSSVCTRFYWSRLIRRRYKMFHPGRRKNDGLNYKSVFELLDDFPVSKVCTHVISNLHYFYKMDGVPRERYLEWADWIQTLSVPFDIMLPSELYEPDPIAKEAADEAARKAREEEHRLGLGGGRNLFSKVKVSGMLNPDDILGKSKVQYVSQEDKDRRLHTYGMRRVTLDRIFTTIGQIQEGILQRYYPEKPVVFPIHPYLPPDHGTELFERVPELSHVSDGEDELIDTLRNPRAAETFQVPEDEDEEYDNF